MADGGVTSTKWEALQHTQRFLKPEALAGILEYFKSELINRPGVGLSELGGVLMNLNEAMIEGGRLKIFHPDLVAK